MRGPVHPQRNGHGDDIEDSTVKQDFSVTKRGEQAGAPPRAPRGPRNRRLEQVMHEDHGGDGLSASQSSRGQSTDNDNRSASPERDAWAYYPASVSRYRDRAEPSIQPGFGEPYLHADNVFQRDKKRAPQNTAEFQRRRWPSEAYRKMMDFAVYFSEHTLRPEDIDGHFFVALREAKEGGTPKRNDLECLAMAINGLSGHVNGNLYHLNYSKNVYTGSEERIKRLHAGAVVYGASVGVCHNKKGVSIDDLCSYCSILRSLAFADVF